MSSTNTIRAGLAACGAVLALAGVALADGAPAQHTTHHHRSAVMRPDRGSARLRRTDSVGEGRPRETLFMTNAQLDALNKPYNDCLNTQAPPPKPTNVQAGQAMAAVPITPDYERAYEQAQITCHNLDPLPPWQYDATNPRSLAFVDAVVSCLRQHGVSQVQAEAAGPGEDRNDIALGGPDNDSRSITLGLDEMTACEHAALTAR